MPILDWIALVLGTILGIVSLTADVIGIGAFPGFGWRQALGVGAAVLLVGASAGRIWRRDRPRRP